MNDLRVLGALDLQRRGGAKLLSVLAQPHRTALLCYLALARPRGFHRRDTLLALFWPESDTEHARAALRQAVYVLRRSLSEEVILSRGDEEIGLAEGAVCCDAVQFEAALDAADPERALALYGGDLLPGFFIDGAPAFETWLEGERARLHQRALDAYQTLVEARARAKDSAGAAEWARRGLELAPADNVLLLELMRLLAGRGDPPGALAAYEAHARRLRDEFEIEPSPEARALAQALQRGVPPAGGRVAAEESGPRTAAPAPQDPDDIRAPAATPAAPEAVPSLPERNRPLASWPGLRSLIPWTLACFAGAWLLFEITRVLARALSWGDGVGAVVTAMLALGWFALLLRIRLLAKSAATRVTATRLLTLAGILAIAGAGAALLGGHSRGPAGGRPVEAGPIPAPWFRRAAQVTTSQAEDNAPRWSPDGRALVFQSDRTGNQDIWVTQPGSWQAVNRTSDSPADDFQPTWSPDGQWIAFFSGREGGGYFVMPSVGGTALKVTSWPRGRSSPTPAAWSPDGAQLAFGVNQRSRGPSIEILTLATGVSRRVPLPSRPRGPVLVDMNWSPDGRWLAYRRAISAVAATAELWLTSISGGQSVQLTGESSWNGSPTWSPDARRLYFVSDRGGTSDVWSLAIGPDGHPLGAPRQMTSGQQVDGPQLSPDGARLAYTKRRFVRNVYRAPILSARPATWAEVTQLTFEDADYESIDISRDGRLIFSTNRTGNWDLFITSSQGGALEPFVTHPALDAGPRWTHDGSAVVFYSNRSGHREVWIQPVGGGPARQVTRGELESFYPTVSPDNREVAVQTTGRGIPVVTLASGTERRLTDDLDGSPDWSPDGRSVAFHSSRDGNYGIWVVPAAGGSLRKVTASYGLSPRWSPDGKLLYYLHGDSGPGNRWDLLEIWAVSPESGRERPVTVLRGRRGFLANPGLATDGRFVYFTWQEVRSDIWVADLATRP